MFGTPSFDSPLTYLGVLLLTVGVYLALSGFGVLKIERYSTPEGVKSWGTGLILVLLGLAILFVLPAYQSESGYQQEVGILRCQNNPNTGIVSAQTPIVLSWGWTTDSSEKRDEFVSITNFILTLDGEAQDISKADRILNSTDAVFWKLSIGKLAPGIHGVELVTILSSDFADSGGTYPAGRLTAQTCDLVVK